MMMGKLTSVLIVTAMLQLNIKSLAQGITLSERNVSLEKVLKKIRIQSGYDFFYSSALIKQARPVSVTLKNGSIDEALRLSFENQKLIYLIEGNTVVVKRSRDQSPAYPPLEARGKVVDDTGQPLSGVTIRVKDADTGTSTDINGEFTLYDVYQNAIIQISFIGFRTKEIPAKAKLGTIGLQVNDEKLDEVVVVGYGMVRKGDLTGSIVSIKPDENEASKSVSVVNILQGTIAGVTINASDASPGAALSVTIRGANSLRGDNQPLFVIDNIPQGSTGEFPSSAFGGGDYQIAQNPLTSLNPSDIEDIQILKDVSATAIYGSRGANGVILITTKKGKAGRTKASGKVNYTVVEATRLRKMMNLYEFADYRNERTGLEAAQYFRFGDEMRYVFSDGAYDPADASSYNILTERNWQKETYRNALSQNYGFAVSGGSPHVRYYLSADHKNINGMVKKTGLEQSGVRLNLAGEVSKKLKFNISLSGNLKENNMMSGGNSRGGATGSIGRTAIDAAPHMIPENDPLLLSNEEVRTTTFAWLNDYDDITSEKTGRISADLNWRITNHVSYTLRTGGNLMLQERARWYGTQLFFGQNRNGYLGITDLNSNNYTVENLLNIHYAVKDILDVSITTGATYDDYNWLNRSTTASDFSFKDLRTRGLHLASIINNQQPQQRDYQLLSYLARANFSFLGGRYLATVTARADGSSKFRASNRWALFPSLSFAWRLEQESFLKDARWLNQLKLRAGFGKTGSQSISPYNSFNNYDQVVDYASPTGVKTPAIAVANLQNADLKWETTYSYSGGLDFSFFKDRIEGSVDVYYKETNDLLIEKGLPTSTSFSTITQNQGSLSNRGWELALKTEVLSGEKLTWSVSGNIAFNRAKILDLGYPESKFGNEFYKAYLGNSIGDHFGVGNIFIAGKAPGLFWGYKTDGVIQTGDTNMPVSNLFTTTPGNLRVVDVTGNGVIDANDMTIIGDPNPDFNYGLQTAVSYKELRLSAAFFGVAGNEILNGNVRYEQTPSSSTSNLTSYAYQNRWTTSNPTNSFPSVNGNIQNVVYDRYVESGNFLRCSDITLNYTIGGKMLKTSVKSLNIFASVKNLFLITNYSGYDPEMRSFAFDGLRPGIDLNSYSNPRQFFLGANINF